MTKKTIPTESNPVSRFFDGLEARHGLPELVISDRSRAFLSDEFERLIGELCKRAYNETQGQGPRLTSRAPGSE